MIERLERIEVLRGSEAPAGALLAELRGLLADGERWLAAEPAGESDGARAALERCRHELERPGEVVPKPAV